MGTVSVRRCWKCDKLTGAWGACIHCGAIPQLGKVTPATFDPTKHPKTR